MRVSRILGVGDWNKVGIHLRSTTWLSLECWYVHNRIYEKGRSSYLEFRVSYMLKAISKCNDTIFTLKYSSCLRHLIVVPVSVVIFIIRITLYTDVFTIIVYISSSCPRSSFGLQPHCLLGWFESSLLCRLRIATTLLFRAFYEDQLANLVSWKRNSNLR